MRHPFEIDRPTRSRTFSDASLERRFRRHGFVVVSVGTDADTRRLVDVYRDHPSGIDHGYYTSARSDNLDYRRTVDDAITAAFSQPLASLLTDHEPLVGAFVVKHPEPGTQTVTHQDWTFVEDESVRPAVICWIPLTPVGEREGYLRVLRGSHRYLHDLRCFPPFPTRFDDVRDEVFEHLMEEVPVQVGEALLIDARLVHGSPAHQGHGVRLVAYLLMMARGAQPVNYYQDDEGTVTGYRVDPTFFITHRIGDRPEGQPLTRVTGYPREPWSYAEVEAIHRRAQRRVGRLRRPWT